MGIPPKLPAIYTRHRYDRGTYGLMEEILREQRAMCKNIDSVCNSGACLNFACIFFKMKSSYTSTRALTIAGTEKILPGRSSYPGDRETYSGGTQYATGANKSNKAKAVRGFHKPKAL